MSDGARRGLHPFPLSLRQRSVGIYQQHCLRGFGKQLTQQLGSVWR
jgi:hypothetical protein